jgi:hypothetical protein
MIQITGSPQDLMADRKIVGESDHFIYYALGEFFPVDLIEWQAQFENVYDYVSGRVGLEAQEKIRLTFDKPDVRPCPGRALSSDSEIIILADEHTDAKQILGGLAHEIGHALTLPALENQLQNYLYFEEGYATWAAGDYWIDWHGISSLNEMVQRSCGFRCAQPNLPLHLSDVEPGSSYSDPVGFRCAQPNLPLHLSDVEPGSSYRSRWVSLCSTQPTSALSTLNMGGTFFKGTCAPFVGHFLGCQNPIG